MYFFIILSFCYNSRFINKLNNLIIGEKMAMDFDIKEYVGGFISAFIGVVIAVTLVPQLLNVVNNVTGVPLLTTAIVGTIVGAGILLFILKTFL